MNGVGPVAVLEAVAAAHDLSIGHHDAIEAVRPTMLSAQDLPDPVPIGSSGRRGTSWTVDRSPRTDSSKSPRRRRFGLWADVYIDLGGS